MVERSENVINEDAKKIRHFFLCMKHVDGLCSQTPCMPKGAHSHSGVFSEQATNHSRWLNTGSTKASAHLCT